jgi:hypothetical protein
VFDDFHNEFTTAYLTLTVNYPPRSGTLISIPDEGIAYKTEFELFAHSWIDEDLPLTYIYGFDGKQLSDAILD